MVRPSLQPESQQERWIGGQARRGPKTEQDNVCLPSCLIRSCTEGVSAGRWDLVADNERPWLAGGEFGIVFVHGGRPTARLSRPVWVTGSIGLHLPGAPSKPLLRAQPSTSLLSSGRSAQPSQRRTLPFLSLADYRFTLSAISVYALCHLVSFIPYRSLPGHLCSKGPFPGHPPYPRLLTFLTHAQKHKHSPPPHKQPVTRLDSIQR